MVLFYLVFLVLLRKEKKIKEEMKASENLLIISSDITPVNVRNSKSGGLIPGLGPNTSRLRQELKPQEARFSKVTVKQR